MTRSARIASNTSPVTEGDGRTRNRYRGAGKRGRMSALAGDALNCRLALDELAGAMELFLHAGREIERIAVTQATAAARAKVRLAARLVDHVLYPPPKPELR